MSKSNITPGMCRLDGKVALVSGGSRGIGKAIALGLARVGSDIVIASRNFPGLEGVAQEVAAMGRRSLPVAAHLAKIDDINQLVEKAMARFGHIDILVNNAGTSPYFGQLVDAEEWAWDSIINLNLKGYFLLSQAVAKVMIKQGGGCIINIASAAGMKPYPGLGIYSISKAGVIMLTRVLAMELGRHNIRVNAIAPGITKTRLTSLFWEKPELLNKVAEHTALGRMAEPEDMVGAAVFLATDCARHISGETITIEGGWITY